MPQLEALQRALTSIDVSDPRLYQDDTWRPLFAQLRRDDPVHYCEASPFGPYWSVTRYDDIFSVELDHENYSSSSELGGIQVADQPKGQERASFIRMDPPGHTAQRRTVAPIVAPSNLLNLEPLIRKRTTDVLDALPRNETFDWVERVSVELTNMMLATLFDFPWEDRERLTWWSDVAIANVDSPDAVVRSEHERFAELTKMGGYFRKLWDARAGAPPTFDLISMLAHADATRNMPPREFIGTLGLLIVGGNDTRGSDRRAARSGFRRFAHRTRLGSSRRACPDPGPHSSWHFRLIKEVMQMTNIDMNVERELTAALRIVRTCNFHTGINDNGRLDGGCCALNIRREGNVMVVRDPHGRNALSDTRRDKALRPGVSGRLVRGCATWKARRPHPVSVPRRMALEVGLMPDSAWMATLRIGHNNVRL
jgi:hypothetical protein